MSLRRIPNPILLEHGQLVLMGALGETFYLLANQVMVTEKMMMLKALVTILIKIYPLTRCSLPSG